ncbi:MAG: imidazolonepropionase [Candidatus Zixiibacteriota bacterium]|nr:MAG: imidazolonepropionase [candidate division Zixibacteria bacterium]
MMTPKKATLLIKNIGQLVTMSGPVPRRGMDMRELGLLADAGVAICKDTIIAVGASEEIERGTPLVEGADVIDAEGKVVTPGLIDPHTHPVFAMTREAEFEMRTLGKSYEEIAAAGGGIRASVRDLREASSNTLIEKTRGRLDRLLAHGVTTIEAKSGYGLSTEAELKSLKVIQALNESHPVDLVPTFLGAHEVPDEYRDNREAYIDILINEMIPAVVEQKLAEYSDIFCEKDVYSIDESRRIQQAAKDAGLKLRFHVDELAGSGGAELAAEMKARTADHLVYASDTGIKALAASGTVAVLLPGTTFSLRGKQYAPARKMIEAGVTVALSTDCNPGYSYTESLPLIVSLACLQMRLTAAEALSAVTVNAAVAIDRGDRIGRIEPDMQADVVIWDMADYRELPYHYGVNLVSQVIKNGKVVVRR